VLFSWSNCAEFLVLLCGVLGNFSEVASDIDSSSRSRSNLDELSFWVMAVDLLLLCFILGEAVNFRIGLRKVFSKFEEDFPSFLASELTMRVDLDGRAAGSRTGDVGREWN